MKGVYCVIIEVPYETTLRVGALGRVRFRKGYYAYVGSAQNNLEKRAARHLKKKKKLRWHIDYLLSGNARVRKVLYKMGDKEQECLMARALLKSAEPVNGFGCSDCSCRTHLFMLRSLDMLFDLKLKELKT